MSKEITNGETIVPVIKRFYHLIEIRLGEWSSKESISDRGDSCTVSNGSAVSKWCTQDRCRSNSSYWSSSNRSNRCGVGTNNGGGSGCTEGGSRFVDFNGSSESQGIGNVVHSACPSVNVGDGVGSFLVTCCISDFSPGVSGTVAVGYSVVKSIVTDSLERRIIF